MRAGEVGGRIGIARIAGEEGGRYSLEFDPRGEPACLPPVCLILGHPRPIVLRRLLRDLTAIGPGGIVVTHTDLGEKSYYESNLWADVRTPLLDGAAQGGTTLVPSVRKAGSLAEATAAADSVVAEAASGASPGHREPRRLVLHADGAAVARSTVHADGAAVAVPAADDDRPQAPPAIAEALGAPDPGTPVVLAVGSERGWTPREIDALAGLGFVAATLGDRVLRTETAALVATWAAVSWYHRRS